MLNYVYLSCYCPRFKPTRHLRPTPFTQGNIFWFDFQKMKNKLTEKQCHKRLSMACEKYHILEVLQL